MKKKFFIGFIFTLFFLAFSMANISTPAFAYNGNTKSIVAIKLPDGKKVYYNDYEKKVNKKFLFICGDKIEEGLHSLFEMGESRRNVLNYVSKGLGDILINCASKYERASRRENMVFRPWSSQRFTYEAPEEGLVVNWDKIYKDIARVLSGYSDEIELSYEIIEAPKAICKNVKNFTARRGGFVTKYEFSSVERAANVALAARLINGAIIKGGAKFSFNTVVGARSKERGFQEAKIILDGEFVLGIGGGVCQVSTTLYNAVLLSDLKVVVCAAHSMKVSYVPLSRDAMVTSLQDFVFQNNTEAPIYIEARGDNGKLEINIYGYKRQTGDKVELITEDMTEYPKNNIELNEGKGDIILSPECYRSELRVIKYIKGIKVSDKVIRHDKYAVAKPQKEVDDSQKEHSDNSP